jgi:hypothetical protein
VDRPAAASELACDEVELDVEVGRHREGSRARPERGLGSGWDGGLRGANAGPIRRAILEPEDDPGSGACPCPPVPCGAAPGSVPVEVALDSHWPIVAWSR